MHGNSYPYTRQPEDGDGASPRLSVGGTSAKELDREGKEIMGFRYRFNEESATRESEPTPRYVRSANRGPRVGEGAEGLVFISMGGFSMAG